MMSILSPTALRIFFEGLQRRPEFVRRYVVSLAALRGDIEGPDLHARNALFQQGMGKLVGAVQERVQILVVSFRIADAPIGDFLSAAVANVPVTGAGVVNANLVARPAAQHVADGLAVSFAEQIPQGDVDGGITPRFDAGRTPAEIILDISVDAFDLKRVATDQLGRHGLMDVGLDRSCAHKSLAEAVDSIIRVQADPDDVREFLESDRFNSRDLHGILIAAAPFEDDIEQSLRHRCCRVPSYPRKMSGASSYS